EVAARRRRPPEPRRKRRTQRPTGDRDRGVPARRVVLPPGEVPLVRGPRAPRPASRTERGDLREGARWTRPARATDRGAVRRGEHPGDPADPGRRRAATARDPGARTGLRK